MSFIDSLEGKGALGVIAVLFVASTLVLVVLPNFVTGTMFVVSLILLAFAVYRELDGELTLNFR